MWTDLQNSFTNRFVRKFSMYIHKDFHLTYNMLLHYLVKVANPKLFYQTFMLNLTIDMFN